MAKCRKKSFVGYIYSCEFRDVLAWKDDFICMNEDTQLWMQKLCPEHEKHPIIKVRVSLEQLPSHPEKRRKKCRPPRSTVFAS